MKKISIIFITFSGIYSAFGQNREQNIDSGDVIQNVHTDKQPGKIDSLQVKNTPSIRLFPNPAKNKVEIEIKSFEPGQVLIQLLDINGNRVREDKRTVFSGNEIIVFMFSEKPGLYYLLLRQGEISIRNRLVIQ